MADNAANDGQRLGIMQWLGALLLVTALSVGAGVLASFQLMSTFQRISENKKEAQEKPISSAFNPNDRLRKITPVVTNLAAPPNAWIRLEASIVTDKLTEEEASMVVARIGEDIATYMRTLTPTQIEGARGLQYLREDLNERALMRSSGKVRELIIETLVVQ
ncbi:flagellar basal body-associated FliL family protein [Tardiphaga sp. 813_E8_N1_3]|uniref:flagellar basal body-associated FliL family protein n=1 Tax=Tardiphaga sp. 813_E8_N1_3 TaxID=3240760 RepID=UPI003F1F43D4